MRRTTRLIAGVTAWLAAISSAHLMLNVDWSSMLNEYRPKDSRKLNVAFIPVT